jgi:hypothetical protein
MHSKKTLLIGILLILTACQTQQTLQPTKPHLTIQKQADGGICLDKDNAAKLGVYILELERR